jgi:hypothetical protein
MCERMDWLEFQHSLRPHWQAYFSSRALTSERVAAARSSDIGAQAKDIDAAIRLISRQGNLQRMSELDKDILGIRLDWAWHFAMRHLCEKWPIGDGVNEEEFERLLIDRWREVGRIEYEMRSDGIKKILKKPSRRRPRPGEN